MTSAQDQGDDGSQTTSEPVEPDITAEKAIDFLLREWDRMWATKASLEQRAITVITTSGVLVTLSFGFAAAVTKNKKLGNFSDGERAILVVSLGLFALAALIALRVNLPKGYSVPDFRDRLGISRGPIVGEPLQRFENALESGREQNDAKARALALAFFFQFLAVAALAASVGAVTID